MMRIQIHHYQDNVGEVLGAFTIANQLLVIHFVETKAPVTVKGRIVRTNPVDSSDEALQTVGAVNIPVLDLVLF